MDSSILGFFKDPDASSVISIKDQQIAAPIVRGQDLTSGELAMGGGLRVVHYILDRSPSMIPVGAMLVQSFNNDLVPAIEAAREDDIAALRIGGTSFSSDITPIWCAKGGPAYHSLKDLPKVTKKEYNLDLGSGTALHDAILDGTTRAMKYAAQVENDTGIQPDIDIVILTDGANNCNPRDPNVVRTMVEGTDRNRVRFIYFFFETGEHVNCRAHAKDMGFDPENVEQFLAKAGEGHDDLQKRFRRMMRVMSRVSASKGTSAVKAVQATPDDDLI